jgi:hypothetical protein
MLEVQDLILIVSGAVKPPNNDLNITDDGDHLVFDGFKNFVEPFRM